MQQTITKATEEIQSGKWMRVLIDKLEMAAMDPMNREYIQRQMVKAVHFAEREKKRHGTVDSKLIEEEITFIANLIEKNKIKDRVSEVEKLRQEKEEMEQTLNKAISSLFCMGIEPERIAKLLEIPVEKVLKVTQEYKMK